MARLLDESLVAAQAGIAGVPGQSVPGFGHPLHADGDARAAALASRIIRRR